MHFSNPEYLWLLWLLPLVAGLLVFSARLRRKALERFADSELLPHLAPLPSPSRTFLRSSILGLAVAGIVLAGAGPRWGFEWEEVHRRGVDVVVALNLSRSMLAEDLEPNRLIAAKRELRDLLDLLRGDRVGLVAFAGMAFVQCPLTLDYRAIEVFLDRMDPNWVPVGGTDLAAAVRTGIGAFPKQERSGRALLLITDGEDHSGELQEAALEAKKAGVHVFVVGMGAPEGAPVPDGQGGFIKEGSRVVLSKLDEASLKELALTTGGSYVRGAPGDLDLKEIYLEDIKGSLEARDLSSSRQRRWEERFQWALLPALLVLLFDGMVGSPSTKRRRRRGSALTRSGGPSPLLLLGFVLFFSATLTTPTQASFWRNEDPDSLGHAAFENQEFQAALDRWLEAQIQDPSDPRLDYNIGQAHYRLGDFAAAEQAFRKASATDQSELAADALYNTGNAAFQQGKYLEAIAAYESCLELRPDDEDAEANRDLAQRRYEELLEESQQQPPEEQQQEPPPESEDQENDPDSEDQKEGEEGEGEDSQEQQEQEQQQGQAGQQEEQPPEEQQAPEPEESDSQQGGQASAADINRDGESEEENPSSGAIDEQTEEDPTSQEEMPPIEGALTKEQAEALLRALDADQAARRKERTDREAQRGSKGAAKDW